MTSGVPPWWFFAGLPILTAGTAVFILSRASGWLRLARAYPGVGDMPRPRLFLGYGVFRGWIGYNGSLVVASDAQGLYLAGWPVLLAWCHPPIFIPWGELRVEPRRSWFGESVVRLVTAAAPEVNLALRGRTWAHVAARARQARVPGAE